MNLPSNIKRITIHKGRSVGMTTVPASLTAHYFDGTCEPVIYDHETDVLIKRWTKILEPLFRKLN